MATEKIPVAEGTKEMISKGLETILMVITLLSIKMRSGSKERGARGRGRGRGRSYIGQNNPTKKSYQNEREKKDKHL